MITWLCRSSVPIVFSFLLEHQSHLRRQAMWIAGPRPIRKDIFFARKTQSFLESRQRQIYKYDLNKSGSNQADPTATSFGQERDKLMWGWLKCNTGFHDFTEWSYLEADKCEQSRMCNRCRSEEKRVAPHGWSEWDYIEDDKCDQKHTCARCMAVEKKVTHQWGVWELEAPNSCVQVRFCRRCYTAREEKEPRFDDHQWTEPKRIDCNRTVQTCQRCRKMNEKRVSLNAELHVYGPWELQPGGGSRRVCQECGDTDRKFS